VRSNFFKAINDIVAIEGVGGLYRGIAPAILREMSVREYSESYADSLCWLFLLLLTSFNLEYC
jgi:hypothetical protein